MELQLRDTRIATQNEEIAAQKEQINRQERQLLEAVDREHFRKLWEMRQKGYLEIVSWALSLRESIRLVRDGNLPWSPPILSESDYGMSALFLYADFAIYDKARSLHGGVSSTVEDMGPYEGEGPEVLLQALDSYDEEAWQLVMLVREYSLQRPVWREPIAFDGAVSESENNPFPLTSRSAAEGEIGS